MGTRQLNRLSAITIASKHEPGLYCYGGGLYLRIAPSGSKTWMFRYRSPLTRKLRVAVGNLGDVETVGDGVLELRVDWGPGYRVYFARVGQVMVLLLCGGDKRTQQRDIERAKTYFKDYKVRSAKARPPGRRA